jgi:RHS repeat-associated protein
MFFVQVDHLNTPRSVADQSGQTVWRWDQDEPFGANVANENPSGLGVFEFPLRYPGQYFDKETNVSYNYFRDYDSSIGRYVEADPIGIVGLLYGNDTSKASIHSLSLYLYVSAAPIGSIDPMGLEVAEGPRGPYSKDPEAYGDIPREPPPPQSRPDNAGRYDICPGNWLRTPCKWCINFACNSGGISTKAYCCDVDRRKCIAGATDDPGVVGRCNAEHAACMFRGGKK